MTLFLFILFIIALSCLYVKDTTKIVTYGDVIITLAICTVGFKINEFIDIYKSEIKRKKENELNE